MPAMNVPRSPWKTRYFLDTEFTSFDACQLISIAIVGEDGREFYAERSDFDTSLCSDFVRQIVLPKLGQSPQRSMPLGALRQELVTWLHGIPLRPKPVLSYDYEGDLTLLGDLIDGPLPPGWKAENIFMRLDARRLAEYFAEHGEHHALVDARANAHAFI